MNELKTQLLRLMAELEVAVNGMPDNHPLLPNVVVKVVTESRAAELSGYTVNQLRGRRKNGHYEYGVVWWHDEFGKVVFDFNVLQDRMLIGQQKGDKKTAPQPKPLKLSP